ncbi:hypothetical protein ACN6LA_003449 [Streptomyces sp. SAS_269]|uniref:hypothetical protein n=1 Tax=Streptomyces sp. SAS_269 TaxID=3412749 RepID=UPI00403CF402
MSGPAPSPIVPWPVACRPSWPGPKHLVRFTEQEGAHLHCEPLGRALFEQRVFDWLDARVAAAGTPLSPNDHSRVTH